ncbi:MAG: hypothetical protein A2509_07425 [Candidatus Edwardsbacteria bacterium RIFOXYD12_FULL_50_11]|uniref:Uncharacterized protein n=1 Tax=Candidatus Edwardsbacteria bacterium GWF2_54_11 TaxID=1817851 RepID=A0A1F5RGC0_9BACT|nr:MAG: hypothetical protein A2502_00300 [Candidatus Edwardsbacteria bacterium RifOxyC12_full_54_24]OGF06067.1 MAG: hypothetical protein A2273_09770 [Candidatus Edwardsbacteria bacterium RifOxyA12_full_54_48]OGF11874.1 MAG: hypothetical protein A3K15_02505 [Candidatus Edwardsbacteria bacterium GWE2_54_12]OGF13495.1 MAG: hypothetical protein A2024_11260 [Candidatus Edwardsbacteria bacterium GWF2_54_11]OGF17108.1 MAG: hypothetical protein A2509_07425 [Candidatus Edwardsbacteria bacterium RIFOXYD1
MDTSKLRTLYQKNEIAHLFFDYIANRKNNASESRIHRIISNIKQGNNDISRSQVIELLKELENIGCGEFVAGRHGWPSRFVWNVGMISVGKIARGESQEAEELPEEIETQEEDIEMIAHAYFLRANMQIEIELPDNLTKSEANRMAEFIKSLPFENNEQ